MRVLLALANELLKSAGSVAGIIKRKQVEEPSTTSKPQKRFLDNSLRTQNLVKPQLAFEVKPDNEDTSPWLPLLKTKPHAKVSLEDSLGMITNEFDQKQYKHPYETEILQLQYPKAMYEKSEPVKYLPFESTSAKFIDTYEGVLEMLEELKSATEIAVDLEHHDTRSYIGLVSLMQISTREKDWIVDTLKPWRQQLQVLNEVFADPSIIKVFHGAFMDIVWLQRDLGLAGGSLAFLLKKYIDFDADKKYQLADWRIRPLPEEMFFYARSDTHFLLYIFDNLRNELIDAPHTETGETALEAVLQKSKETSLFRYERQTPALLNSEQFAVFKAVHAWRDQIARKDDDSINFVMSNSVVVNLAKFMPMDMIALLGIIRPISHSVKSRTGELLEIIKSAKANGKDGPKSIDVLRKSPDVVGTPKSNTGAKSTPQKIYDFDVTPVDKTELTTGTSSFWGGAFGSSLWEPSIATPDQDSMRLAIPLPQLSEEVFASLSTPLTDRSRLAIPEAQTPTATPTPSKIKDEAFVLKRGSKRKSDVMTNTAEDQEVAGKYDITLDWAPDDAEIERRKVSAAIKAAQKEEKRASKKQRKEEERQRKEEKQNESDKAGEEVEEAESESEEQEEEEEDFDYSKADSVLNSKKAKAEKGGKGGKSKER
ncbi:hypothetical protein DID88_001787 [Monilinia fructigena]|uniref:HRDC domain-containing protein n=1 Tax=Monilinia fructigena TaxID=38457 RepID=A0A395IXN5_9HELO|nr:hypothetical protein DID88_001787 [Monilinia fructigena]